MRFSVACLCGYETPLVDNEEDLDYDLLHAHQEFCKVYLENTDKYEECKECGFLIDPDNEVCPAGSECICDLKEESLHDLISNFSRIEYLEFCAEQDISGDSAQEMSWFVSEYQDNYEWVIQWINEFRGEEE